MEPRKPVLSPTPGRAYPTAVKTARVPVVGPVRPDGGVSRGAAGSNGVVLPMINPPSSSGTTRTNSPGGTGGKRTGWTTPRNPSDMAPAPPAARPPGRNARILDNGGEFQDSSSPSSVGNVSFWNDGAPAATASSTDDPDQDEAGQLAYMDGMYSRIQQLNAELDRDQEMRNLNIEHQVEQREREALEAMQRYGSHTVEDSENFGVVGAQTPLQSAYETNAATVNRKFRPHQPRSTSPPQPTALLPKDQLELCAALGKNAELRIRAREIERQAEEASTVIEQSQRQMKMAERRIANREEKLRALLKEKLHWQSEMKDLREQVVEEKMRQVDLMRRLETNKRETTAQLDHMGQSLRDAEDDNQALRAYLVETKSHLAMQTKRFEEFVKQARDEKEKLTECIMEARGKFRDWKEGEANALKAQRDQALNHLRAEYELKIARHQDEKQKLREKVKDLEVSVRLMQKDRSLSPLELSLRKATILGSKEHAGTTEAELIEAHVRIKELEALLEHSQDFQKRQESIIKVSETTISRLIQEREVAALDTLANQQVAGSQAWANSALNVDLSPLSLSSFSSSGPASAMSLSPGKLSTLSRPGYSSGSTRTLSQSPSHRVDPSPPPGRPKMPDQPYRPAVPSPRAHAVLSPSRPSSRDRTRVDEVHSAAVPQVVETTSVQNQQTDGLQTVAQEAVSGQRSNGAEESEDESLKAEHKDGGNDTRMRDKEPGDMTLTTTSEQTSATNSHLDIAPSSQGDKEHDDDEETVSTDGVCEEEPISSSDQDSEANAMIRDYLNGSRPANSTDDETNEVLRDDLEAADSSDLSNEVHAEAIEEIASMPDQAVGETASRVDVVDGVSPTDIDHAENSIGEDGAMASTDRPIESFDGVSSSRDQLDDEDIENGDASNAADEPVDSASDPVLQRSEKQVAVSDTTCNGTSPITGGDETNASEAEVCDKPHTSGALAASDGKDCGEDAQLQQSTNDVNPEKAESKAPDRPNEEFTEVSAAGGCSEDECVDAAASVAAVVVEESNAIDGADAWKAVKDKQDCGSELEQGVGRGEPSTVANESTDEGDARLHQSEIEEREVSLVSAGTAHSTESDELVASSVDVDTLGSGNGDGDDVTTSNKPELPAATWPGDEATSRPHSIKSDSTGSDGAAVMLVLSEAIDSVVTEGRSSQEPEGDESCNTSDSPSNIDAAGINTDARESVEFSDVRVANSVCDSVDTRDECELTCDQAGLVRVASKALIDAVQHEAVAKVSADLLAKRANDFEADASGDRVDQSAAEDATACVVELFVEETESVAIAELVADEAERIAKDLCVATTAEDVEQSACSGEASIIETREEQEMPASNTTEAQDGESSPSTEISEAVAIATEEIPGETGVDDDQVNQVDVQSSVVAKEQERALPPIDGLRQALDIPTSTTDQRDRDRATEDLKIITHDDSTHRESVAQMMATSLICAVSAQVVGTIAVTAALRAKTPVADGRSNASAACDKESESPLPAPSQEARGEDQLMMNSTCNDEVPVVAMPSEDERAGEDVIRCDGVLATERGYWEDIDYGDSYVFSSDDAALQLVSAEETTVPETEEHPVGDEEPEVVKANTSPNENNEPSDQDPCHLPSVGAINESPAADSPTEHVDIPAEPVLGGEFVCEAVENAVEECIQAAEAMPLGESNGVVAMAVNEVEDAMEGTETMTPPPIVEKCSVEKCDDHPVESSKVDCGQEGPLNNLIAIAFVANVEEESIGRVLASLKDQPSGRKKQLADGEVVHAFAEREVNQMVDDCVAAGVRRRMDVASSTPSAAEASPLSDILTNFEIIPGQADADPDASIEVVSEGRNIAESSSSVDEDLQQEPDTSMSASTQQNPAVCLNPSTGLSANDIDSTQSVGVSHSSPELDEDNNDSTKHSSIHEVVAEVGSIVDDQTSLGCGEDNRSPTELLMDETVVEASPVVNELAVGADEPDHGETFELGKSRMIPARDTAEVTVEARIPHREGVDEELPDSAMPPPPTDESFEPVGRDSEAPAPEIRPSTLDSPSIPPLSSSSSAVSLDSGAVRDCVEEITRIVEAESAVSKCPDASTREQLDSDTKSDSQSDAKATNSQVETIEKVGDAGLEIIQVVVAASEIVFTAEAEAGQAPQPEQSDDAGAYESRKELQNSGLDVSAQENAEVGVAISEIIAAIEIENAAETAHVTTEEDGVPSAPQVIGDENPVKEDCKPSSEEGNTGVVPADQEFVGMLEPLEAGSPASEVFPSDNHASAPSPEEQEPIMMPSDPVAPTASNDDATLPASSPVDVPANAPGIESTAFASTAVEADNSSVMWSPSRTESWQDLVGDMEFNPLEMSLGRTSSPVAKPAHVDTSRYQSAIVREQIRDPTLMAYDVKHEQSTPFEMLDERILMIDQNARHMQYDENDKVRRAASDSQVTSSRVAAIEGVLVTKRKKMENEAHRKSIAYRIIPAFNYEPVLIKFQWSDFVVAMPIRLMSSASQINLLNSLNGGGDTATSAAAPAEQSKNSQQRQILTSPIQKMKLILKKGVKLPCGTYVIIAVFNRPLEDGNENLRIQIYDPESVEEFQYDFHEDHLRDYVEVWKGGDDESRAFYERLEFRREQGSIIIKMPDKIRQSATDTPDTDAEPVDTTPRVYTPPPMAQLLTNLATTQPLELPPEPQYRLSPNAPASPPRHPHPLLHQATAPHRLESMPFITRIEEDTESVASSITRR